MYAVPETTPNYFVLDTDYSSYSIVYDCFDILGVAKAGKPSNIDNVQNRHANASESIWFLTREQHPAESLVAQGYE